MDLAAQASLYLLTTFCDVCYVRSASPAAQVACLLTAHVAEEVLEELPSGMVISQMI